MPSPIGHALAGIATAWSADRPATTDRAAARASLALTLVCAALAALPDIDLLVPGAHRTVTHSVGAVIVMTSIAAAVTGWVTGKINWRVTALCGLAYASHLVLDLLGTDPSPPFGIQALWPFSHGWFISPWTIFPGTERRHVLSRAAILVNVRAAGVECAILGPIVLLLAWRRRRGKR
jgi:inner membrane protein